MLLNNRDLVRSLGSSSPITRVEVVVDLDQLAAEVDQKPVTDALASACGDDRSGLGEEAGAARISLGSSAAGDAQPHERAKPG